MYALFRREISSFFSTLVGYIVIIVFLAINGLFIWVFPGAFNVIDAGYANVDGMFLMAPWVFLFLVPAITMRFFSEEKRTGTIELILTKPLSDLQIIFAKFSAALFLVVLSLLPTIVYYFSVVYLGNPSGNIDSGAYWGSFVGLFFLAGIYASIGMFTSSLSENQIVSFIFAVIICLVFYIGFDAVSALGVFGLNVQAFLMKLGIPEHYNSMSRGVIDSRDIIYFLSVMAIFLLFTKIVLESRKW